MKIKQSHLFAGVIVILSMSTLNSFLIIKDKLPEDYSKVGLDKKTYQAVFLTNNQIYFGHVDRISSDYLRLKDVYYIQISNDGPNKLVKLGNTEPHGPKNEMTINKSQILFIENLNYDSEVVRGIQKFPK